MFYKTIPNELNFRKAPKVAAGNVIAVLPQGHTVEKIDEAANPWWKIKTTLGGATVEGYVHSSYLKKVSAPVPPVVTPTVIIPPVHLKEGDASVTRSNTRWAFPLGEPNMPRRDVATKKEVKIAAIEKIIQFLDVEKSARYQPKSTATYCNIYAYDFCYLNKVYIPRVWWKADAILKIGKGENVTPLYGNTVTEQNANMLYDWLCDYGSQFGWRRVFNLDELQNAANDGKIGIICAAQVNPNRSGHICAVIPESAAYKAVRTNGKVSTPLQSQAGRTNKKYSLFKWWTSSNYRAFGFWIHE